MCIRDRALFMYEDLEVEKKRTRNAGRRSKTPSFDSPLRSCLLYTSVRAVLSGSSSLMLHKGMEDSLMGRYEAVSYTHLDVYKRQSQECRQT